MNIVKQHQEFKLRLNKVDSNNYQDLKPYQIDSFLNDAALFIIQHYGELFKFQGTQSNKDLFGTLLVKYPDQPALTPDSFAGIQYEYNLKNLKYKYMHLDRAYIQCGTSIIPVSIIRHDEQHKFNDAFQRPSYKWKRLLGIIGKENDTDNTSLYIYSDVSLLDKELRVEYIRMPKQVFFGSYDSIEYINCQQNSGNCDEYYKVGDLQVNSDLPETYHSLQVDVAVFLASGKTENYNLSQFINNKIQSLPK
jgi:hypothetical protein